MRRIVINGREYTAKPFDFNMICDLEDLGVSIEDIERKPVSIVRAYAGICMGKSAKESGLEIQEHLLNGGSFDDIMKVISKEMEESDFFRNLGKNKKEKTPTYPGKKRQKNYHQNNRHNGNRNTGHTGNITPMNGSRKHENWE